MLNIKTRPIGLALAVFVVLYIGLNIFTRLIGPFRIPDSNEYLVTMFVGLFPWIIAGYVAASLAKSYGALYGALLCPITSLIQEADCLIRLPAFLHTCTLGPWSYYLAYGLILGGLGGLIWQIKETIRRRRSNPTKA
jgi:hypothetical protein